MIMVPDLSSCLFFLPEMLVHLVRTSEGYAPVIIGGNWHHEREREREREREKEGGTCGVGRGWLSWSF